MDLRNCQECGIDAQVADVQVLTGAGGPILPGETAAILLDAGNGSKARRLSLAGMLVTTNDAFYALNAVPVSSPYLSLINTDFSQEFYLLAYDAGSEENTESCAHIPGPPCGMPGVRVADGAEGYVYIHSGIHGGIDLDPSHFDWRNPVAKVSVRITRNPH